MAWLAIAVGAHLLAVLLFAFREPVMRTHPIQGALLTVLVFLAIRAVARRSSMASRVDGALVATASCSSPRGSCGCFRSRRSRSPISWAIAPSP